MNTALLDNMTDKEFLVAIGGSVTTDLERMLVNRMEGGERHSVGYEARIDELENEVECAEEDALDARREIEELEDEMGDLKKFARDLVDALKELSPEHEILERESEFAL